MTPLLLKTSTESEMTLDVGNLFQYFTRRTEHAAFLRRRQLGLCSILSVCTLRPVRVGEESRWIQVNFTFQNLKGQDEISSEVSAFQLGEVELAKPSSYGT